MENSINKTGTILLIVLALISISYRSNGQEIKKYNEAPLNEKFVGTYIYDDGKQSLVIKLRNRKDVYIDKLDIYRDMIEGTIEYTKSSGVVMQGGTEPQIVNGGVPPSTPNSMLAWFSDKKTRQRGTVTIELNPQDSTIVFKLTKVPGGVSVNNKSFSNNPPPFTIPTEITLKRKKD